MTTMPLDQMSVEKCSASASSAWLSYLAAILPKARERQKSTAMEMNITSERGDAGLDVDVVKEKPLDGFVDDPDAGEQQQAGLEEGGEIFHFAVAVLVIGVGGLVGNPNRHQRDDGGDQIESGMQSFRKNAQAAGGNAHHNFQRGDGERRQHGVPRHGALFGAHGLRTVNRGRSRHSGIIAMRSVVQPGTSDHRNVYFCSRQREGVEFILDYRTFKKPLKLLRTFHPGFLSVNKGNYMHRRTLSAL